MNTQENTSFNNVLKRPTKLLLKTKKILTRSVDGIAIRSRTLILNNFTPNFVLIGASYKRIDNFDYSNRHINDIVDISELIFSDRNVYISYLLSRSRVLYVCINALIASILNSQILKSIYSVMDTFDSVGASVLATANLKSLFSKFRDLYLSFINAIVNKYNLINDYILTDIIDELILLLKIARRVLNVIVKITITPVLTVLVLSISTVSVTASAFSTETFNANNFKNNHIETSKSTNLSSIKPIFAENEKFTTDFTILKQDLIKASSTDLSTKAELKNEYIFKLGDNLDILAKRWKTSKELILLSNLEIDFYNPSVDLINKKIYLPATNSVWLTISTNTTSSSLAETLNISTADFAKFQPNKFKTNYSKGDQIIHTNPELENLAKGVNELSQAGLIVNNSKQEVNILKNIELNKQKAIEAENLAKQKAEAEALIKAEEEKNRLRDLEAQEQAAAALKQINDQAIAKKEKDDEIERLKKIERDKLQAQQNAAKNIMVWPTTGRMSRCAISYHIACDIANKVGTPIVAFKSGTVVDAGWKEGGFGNMIQIHHGDGLESIYMHLSSVSVKVGQVVSAGEYIGSMGSTGNSTGSHLHFGIFVNGQEVSPYRYLVWK